MQQQERRKLIALTRRLSYKIFSTIAHSGCFAHLHPDSKNHQRVTSCMFSRASVLEVFLLLQQLYHQFIAYLRELIIKLPYRLEIGWHQQAYHLIYHTINFVVGRG